MPRAKTGIGKRKKVTNVAAKAVANAVANAVVATAATIAAVETAAATATATAAATATATATAAATATAPTTAAAATSATTAAETGAVATTATAVSASADTSASSKALGARKVAHERQDSCELAGSPEYLSCSVSPSVSVSTSSRTRRKRRGTSFIHNNEQNDFHQQNDSERRHKHNRGLSHLSDPTKTKTLDPTFETMVASMDSNLKMHFTETLKRFPEAAEFFYSSMMNQQE